MKIKKSDMDLQNLISRGEYLVVQGNDLAKAFGNLTAFEHKILDYCFSFVKRDSIPEERFIINISNLLKWLQLSSSGTNYKRVVAAFKKLNENTALYIPNEFYGEKGVIMTQLFAYINYMESGIIYFEFSKYAQPYVFDLKKNFYSLHLAELANVKGKYALILLKLWEANRFKHKRITLISGGLEDWQKWFLGKERRMPAGIFLRNVLKRAAKELETKFPIEIVVEPQKIGRNVVGYELEIIEDKQSYSQFYREVDHYEKYGGKLPSLQGHMDNSHLFNFRND